MIQLKESGVVFHEESHTYELEGKRLSGITSLIHDVLHLGVYPDASDFVRNVAIPRAAEYGTSIHKAIEFYDVCGLRNTVYPGRFNEWDVSDELDTYIRHQEGYDPVANEYTVSDNVRYASQIDNVWQKKKTGGIWLVDTKSNNLDYYPGGEEALKEYLSWQLSIYAYLFERQNPGLNVEGLACNWLRKKDGAFWIIERKCDAEVSVLLETEFTFDDDGNIRFVVCEEVCASEETEKGLMTGEAVQFLVQILRKQEELDNIVKDMKGKLMLAMKEAGVKSWDAGVFKVTYCPESSSTQFDSTRFKKENPEVADRYMKTVNKSESIRITLR